MSGTYDIEAVRRKYISFETAPARGRYPVEYDAIRRHTPTWAQPLVPPAPNTRARGRAEGAGLIDGFTIV